MAVIHKREIKRKEILFLFTLHDLLLWESLCLCSFTETILKSSRQCLQVRHAARARRSPPLGLCAPLITSRFGSRKAA